MKCARPKSRLPEVASVGQLRFVFWDILVPSRFERWNPAFDLDQHRDTDDDVDDGFGSKARNRGAPDMFDNGFASSEHRCQNAAFLVESTRPVRIIGDDGHWGSHFLVGRSHCELAIDTIDPASYTLADAHRSIQLVMFKSVNRPLL